MTATYTLPPELERFAEQIASTQQQHVSLTVGGSAGRPARCSHSLLGGVPAQASADEWPHDAEGDPMAFVLQLNLGELPPADRIPHEGMVQFFLTPGCWRSQFVCTDAITVRYYPAEVVPSLEPATAPELKSAGTATEKERPPRPIVGVPERMVAPGSDDRSWQLCEELADHFGTVDESGLDGNDLHQAYSRAIEPGGGSRVGGYPTYVQADERLDPEILLLQLDHRALRCSTLRGWPADGLSHFFIDPDALVAGDFTCVRYHWERP